MRIALLQTEAVPLDVEANLATLRARAAEARAAGAELVLTPELFVTGYAPNALRDWLGANDVDGIPAQLAQIAAEAQIAVVASYPHRHEDGGVTISAALWDAAGTELLRYDKVHLWGDEERATFAAAADQPAIVEWNGWQVGMQICYDIEFPEPTRGLARRGANLVLVPTAIDETAHHVPDLLVPSRAAENAVVVAYADHPAADREQSGADPVSFAGRSVVANWNGEILGKAGAAEELLIAELPDPAQVPASRSHYLRDHRPELYAQWAESGRPRRTAP